MTNFPGFVTEVWKDRCCCVECCRTSFGRSHFANTRIDPWQAVGDKCQIHYSSSQGN